MKSVDALGKVLICVLLVKLYALGMLYVLFLNTPLREDENLFLFRSTRQSYSARRFEIERSFWERLQPYDGQWYRDIAHHGYRRLSSSEHRDGTLPEGNYAFFPLLPLVIRLATAIAGTYAAEVTLILLTLASAAGVIVVWSLAGTYGVDKGITILLLLAFPSAPFQCVLYTEGLFLLLSSLLLWFCSRRQLLGAVTCGFLGGLCRPQGILLALPLAAEFVLPHLRRSGGLRGRPIVLRVAACMAPLSGFAALASISSVLTGSPKAFLGIQSSWGRSYQGSGLVDSLLSVVGYAGPPVDLLGLAVGLGMLPLIWKRLPLSVALFGTGMVLLPLLTGSILSFGRFISVSVPHFLALALYLGPRSRLRVVTILAFLTFQVLLAKGLIGWYFVG